MDETKIIELQSKLDGKFAELIRIMLSKERKDKKFAVDYMNSIYKIVNELESEGASPLEAFEKSRKKADEATVLLYKPESDLKFVRAKPIATEVKKDNEKESNGCTHKNKAQEELFKVCKDCGDVLEENNIVNDGEEDRQEHCENPVIHRAFIKKTMGKNEVRSKNAMYFRSGIKDEKVESVRKIGKEHGVKNVKNKRKEQIEMEVEDKKLGKKEEPKLREVAKLHGVKNLKNKKDEDIKKEMEKDVIEKMKLPELREIAKKHGMKDLKNKKKVDIISFIREKESQ